MRFLFCVDFNKISDSIKAVFALVVQWTEYELAELAIGVRLLSRAHIQKDILLSISFCIY